jgi:CRP-like cAMP-binding protein
MKSIYKNFFKKRANTDPIQKIISQVPIFEKLSDKELNQIIRLTHVREYKLNEAVFKKLSPGEGMYIVIEGAIQISEPDSKVIFANLNSGDFFGELALLDEEPRSATAIATEEARLIGFFRTDMLVLMKRYPDLGNKILLNLSRVLGERLRQTNLELTKKNN